MFLRTRLVSLREFWIAETELGSVYFIRDAEADAIKVGYSRDHWHRLSDLQVGSARKLELIGVVAAPPDVEPLVHQQLREGHLRGEWFWDRGVTMKWLMDMTHGEPFCRNIWDLVPGKEIYREALPPG
jgi:hypothetical protein